MVNNNSTNINKTNNFEPLNTKTKTWCKLHSNTQITTYAINAYHHWCCEFESRSGRGVQHYVIKFVSDLGQVGGFLHQ